MTNFDKVIPPGSEGKVYASVDLSHAQGPIEKSVEITTNDSDLPSTRLFIRAVVKTYVEIKPSDVIRFNLNKGETQTQEAVLTNTYDKPIKLHDPVVDSDMFDVKLESSGDDGKQYKLTVTAKNNLKIGLQKATVNVAVDGAPVNSIPVQVFAVVRGPISAVPQTVVFSIHTYPEQVVLENAADLRQQANRTSSVVEKLEPGASLQVVAQQNDWYQVIGPNEKMGWVGKSVVKVTKPAGELQPQTVTIQKKEGTFKILNIVAGTPKVKAEQVAGGEDGKSYTLKVMVTDTKGLPQNGSIGSMMVPSHM